MFHDLLDRRHDEDGFTLVELMVVVLIIAILIAITVPSFLGAQDNAKDRQAQTALRNALVAADTLYADSGDFSGVTAAALEAREPSLNYVAATAASTSASTVSVGAYSTNTIFAAAALSSSTSCFWIKKTATGTSAGTTYGKGTTCTADAANTGATLAKW
jgi:type IV pilus assembly protein PilA